MAETQRLQAANNNLVMTTNSHLHETVVADDGKNKQWLQGPAVTGIAVPSVWVSPVDGYNLATLALSAATSLEFQHIFDDGLQCALERY